MLLSLRPPFPRGYNARMSERKTASWPIVAAVIAALVLAPFGLYVGGYFALPTTEYEHNPYSGEIVRIRWFSTEWQYSIYELAGRVEALLTGRNISIGISDDAP